MDIQQEQKTFCPITITLSSKPEAKALFDLIDKLESFRVNVNCEIKHTDFSKDEILLIKTLSDSRKTKDITI